MIWKAFQQEPTVQTIFSDWLWKAGTLICNKLLLIDVNPGGGVDSHMKQTGMLVVSLRGVNFWILVLLRVFRAKRQYFMYACIGYDDHVFISWMNEWMCIYIPHISHIVSRQFTILIEWDRMSACKENWLIACRICVFLNMEQSYKRQGHAPLKHFVGILCNGWKPE